MGKLSFGIFSGVTMPGLLFRFGVWNLASCFFVVGVNKIGWQFLPVVGWHFWFIGVVFILGAGSLVPPATFSLGFVKLASLLGLAWLVGVTDTFIGNGSLVPPANAG